MLGMLGVRGGCELDSCVLCCALDASCKSHGLCACVWWLVVERFFPTLSNIAAHSVCWSGGDAVVGGQQRGAARGAGVCVRSHVKRTRVRNRYKQEMKKLEELDLELLMLKVGGQGEGLT